MEKDSLESFDHCLGIVADMQNLKKHVITSKDLSAAVSNIETSVLLENMKNINAAIHDLPQNDRVFIFNIIGINKWLHIQKIFFRIIIENRLASFKNGAISYSPELEEDFNDLFLNSEIFLDSSWIKSVKKKIQELIDKAKIKDGEDCWKKKDNS